MYWEQRTSPEAAVVVGCRVVSAINQRRLPAPLLQIRRGPRHTGEGGEREKRPAWGPGPSVPVSIALVRQVISVHRHNRTIAVHATMPQAHNTPSLFATAKAAPIARHAEARDTHDTPTVQVGVHQYRTSMPVQGSSGPTSRHNRGPRATAPQAHNTTSLFATEHATKIHKRGGRSHAAPPQSERRGERGVCRGVCDVRVGRLCAALCLWGADGALTSILRGSRAGAAPDSFSRHFPVGSPHV